MALLWVLVKSTGQKHSSDALKLSEASREAAPTRVGRHSPRKAPRRSPLLGPSAAQPHAPRPRAGLLAAKLAESPSSSLLFMKV